MGRRILTVNKFMYPRGGDCIVALNTAALLREHGYSVGLWGMDYPDNMDTEMSDIFADRVDFGGGMRDKIRAALRTMGYGGIVSQFEEALRRFRPDTVHFHNIHSYLSPAIVETARRYGCRTIWTLHDYKLSCPAYVCMRGGSPCVECMTDKRAVIRHRCMKGSVAASLTGYAEGLKWSVERLARATDTFICPSRFMRDMAVKSGVPAEKTAVVPNFVDPEKLKVLSSPVVAEGCIREDAYGYFGRLSEEKGICRLLEVASRLKYQLHVYGSGPMEDELRARYGGMANIHLHGQTDAASVARAMSRLRFTIVPSQWYENNPLSAIESLCAGTPVAGAAIGGIPELISPGVNGVLFRHDSAEEMAGAITSLFEGQAFDHCLLYTSPSPRD